ncbi:MAG: 7TM diverse intracellular signaling domain-containing protein [Gammaproteobacteria bacterium]
MRINCLKHRVLMLLVLLPLFGNAQDAAPVLELDDTVEDVDLSPYLRIVEDPSGTLSLADAMQALAGPEAIVLASGIPNFGITSSAYWAVLDLRIDESDPAEWLIELEYPILDRLEMIYINSEGEQIRKVGGDTLPFADRELNFPQVVFALETPTPGPQSIYFRAESEGSVQFPLRLWQPQAFYNGEVFTLLARGLYYGIMLAMMLYNLFIYLSVRDRSYLFYILYVLGITGYQFSSDGFALQFLWPGNPQLGAQSVTFSAGLALVFGLLFCNSFLSVAQHSRKIHRALLGLAAVTVSAMIISLLTSYEVAAMVTPPLSIVVAAAILGTGTWIMLKGFRPARIFMLAWAVFLFATMQTSLQRFGFLDLGFFSQNGVLIGTAIEVILLSLALADRINILMQDKEDAQVRLLENNALTIKTLERADAMKNEFIANVSHELRTPLSGIIGLLDIVIPNVRAQADERDVRNLEIIRSSGKRLTTLVNDIIDISAINRDYLELSRKPVDVGSIVEMVIAMCNPLIGDKPVTLVVDIPARLPLVDADEDRLQQIIFNLTSNAIKFTFEGEIRVIAEHVGEHVQLSISDTGIGIAEDKLEHIFEAFQQADSSTQREFGGTGLGLSITRKLLKLHGSDINLASAEGAGSRFSFNLPVAASQQDTAVERQADAHSLGRGLLAKSIEESLQLPKPLDSGEGAANCTHTILMVDDEPINLHVLQEYLHDKHRLLSAQDGFQALKILETETPDLIILDLMMPRMSGYELCRIIRETHSSTDLPIIILTAKNQVDDLVAGLRAGANDYLTKPFFKEELLARVDKQVQLHDLIQVRDDNVRLQEQIKRYREAETKLHASRQRLARMLDVSSDALLTIDEGGEIVYANRRAEELLQTSEDALLGRPVDILITGEQSGSHPLQFPFLQSLISSEKDVQQITCDIALLVPQSDSEEAASVQASVCILPLNLEQELYVVTLIPLNDSRLMSEQLGITTQSRSLAEPGMPKLIEEVNRNAARTQLIGELLSQVTADKLQQEPQLLAQLENLDAIIDQLAQSVDLNRVEIDFRRSLVELLQYCVEIWQRVTHRHVIDLAEESRIWRVSIDNGRLRARSIERYLDIDKLPKNPRWREVTRTAYYLLGNLELSPADKQQLEEMLGRLQEIVRLER